MSGDDLLPLRAGPLTMRYDATTGFVRWIMLEDREVVRGIYAAVRDRDWGTVPGVVREITRRIESESFHLEFESVHERNEIRFAWRGTLTGDASGTLRYTFYGESHSAFLRNRIGFCVLHPIRECAGARARQLRMDGSVVECRFPKLIEPQIFGQSTFRNLRGMAHAVTEGTWADIEFSGETFEMEDQRNWTDASFKTYCTPLAIPFPVQVSSNAVVSQAVTLRLRTEHTLFKIVCDAEIEIAPSRSSKGAAEDHVTFQMSDAPAFHSTTPLPSLGLSIASHGEPLDEHELTTLRHLGLSHLRVDLYLAETNWQKALEQASREAEQLGTKIELAIHLPANGKQVCGDPTRAIGLHAAKFARVLALREGEPATTSGSLDQVRTLLGRINVPVGAGSDRNFCELNREQALRRVAVDGADFLFWSINPQVHATDHHSIMETIEAQAATIDTARAFADGRHLVISPITLRPRFNAVATSGLEAADPNELPSAVDARQLSPFAAAWTLGSVVSMASAGAKSLTFYETTGWRGVMERSRGSPLNERFPSEPGSVFPLYDVFLAVAGRRLVTLFNENTSRRITGLMSFDPATKKATVLFANLTSQIESVRLENVRAKAEALPTNVEFRASEARVDLKLKPYAFTAIELGT